jgi:His/Glu/Gln/Arg/opine family amino acid ABC transporter permease subunit
MKLTVLSRLKNHLKERYGHLPWFRRYEFLLSGVILTFLLSTLILPDQGRPETWVNFAGILLIFALFFTFAILIITDREKPVFLKRIFSLLIILLFFVFFYQYSGTQWERVRYQFFNVEKLEGVWPLYLNGLLVTLKLSIVSASAAMTIGLVLGILRSLHNPVLELFLSAYIDFFRAMPLIVNMVIVFYALPFLGINLNAFWSASTSLILMNSAYQAEIFRSGIESIPKRQVEAARSLGLRPMQAMRLVILPQAVRIIIPPLSNNLVSLVKDTAVAYVITLPELLTKARHAVVWKRNPTPIIISMFIYLATLLPLTRYTRFLENRSKRWVKR